MQAVTNAHANRRLTRRRQLRHLIHVECRKGSLGLGANLAATFLDISEGGVRIILKAGLEHNQEVEVRLSGPQLTRTLTRIGKVVWALPLEDGRSCVGVQFEKRLAYRDVQLLARP